VQPEAGLWARSKLRPEKHNSSDGAIVRGRNYRCDTGGRHGKASALTRSQLARTVVGAAFADDDECQQLIDDLDRLFLPPTERRVAR